MRKFTAIFMALMLVLEAATGCTRSQQRTDSIVVAIPTDPDGFHPLESVAAASSEIAFNIFEGLVKAAPDGNIIPALATEWEISPDGLRYTFTLREGVQFHNGRNVTPDDVKYCLDRLRDPQVTSTSRDYLEIASVATGANTIVITLKQPNAAFLGALTEFGAVVYPPEAEEQLSTQPIGTGPFQLTAWEPNNQLILTRFANYWNPELPKLEQVTLQITPNRRLPSAIW